MHKLFSTLAISTLLAASSATFADGTSADLVAAALNHADRPSADGADDGRRMPLEVLAFAGIEEGMIVLELEAGGGYYTEIISRAVGASGNVIMQNPAAFDGSRRTTSTQSSRAPSTTTSPWQGCGRR